MVCFKWSPQTEGHLKALALPVWSVLLFYIGKCVCVCACLCVWTCEGKLAEWNFKSSLPLERFQHRQIPAGSHSVRKLSVFLALWGRHDLWDWTAQSCWEVFAQEEEEKKNRKRFINLECVADEILQIFSPFFQQSVKKGFSQPCVNDKVAWRSWQNEWMPAELHLLKNDVLKQLN